MSKGKNKGRPYLCPITEIVPLPAEPLAGGLVEESYGKGDTQDLWGDIPINTPIFLDRTEIEKMDRFPQRDRHISRIQKVNR